MGKPRRALVFGAITAGFIVGACTLPMAPESDRTRASGGDAGLSAAAHADSGTINDDGATATTAADSAVGRGGGFIGSGH
jgi:hypothetical protein